MTRPVPHRSGRDGTTRLHGCLSGNDAAPHQVPVADSRQ